MCSSGPEKQLLCISIEAGSCLGTVINENASQVSLKIAMDVWEYRVSKTTLLKFIFKTAKIHSVKIYPRDSLWEDFACEFISCLGVLNPSQKLHNFILGPYQVVQISSQLSLESYSHTLDILMRSPKV